MTPDFKNYGAALALALLFLTPMATGADWPQWRGIHRDGHSPETDLAEAWPQGGPPMLWSFDSLGLGYSSVAVANGRVYTTGMGDDQQGSLFAFDEASGRLLGAIVYGKETRGGGYQGTRGTPTVDGDRVYILSGLGELVCVNAQTAAVEWRMDILQKFRGKAGRWAVAESVLIDGPRLVCTPGGPNASLVALDKTDGKTVWTSKGLSDAASYCSAILVERGGLRIIVQMTAKHIVGVQAETGAALWKHPHETPYDVHAVTPVYGDGMIYLSSGYGTGGVMLRLSEDGRSVRRGWSDKELDSKHHGVILLDGRIYGAGDRGHMGLVCLDLATGKRLWQGPRFGRASTIYADGRLYCYTEKGQVHLLEANPNAYKSFGALPIRMGSKQHWAHPAIANGRLYVRHGPALMAFDISEK